MSVKVSLPVLGDSARTSVTETVLELIAENARGSADSVGSLQFDLEKLDTYVAQVEAVLKGGEE